MMLNCSSVHEYVSQDSYGCCAMQCLTVKDGVDNTNRDIVKLWDRVIF